MRPRLTAVLLLGAVLLGGCGRLVGTGGGPVPGPTGTPSPGVTGLPGGGEDLADPPVTTGPDLTG
jgi:hypothetical protein